MSATPAIETLTVVCPCGAVHRATVKHYDVVEANCRRSYWALRPKRDGGLILFKWPGFNLTKQQVAEKELREKKDAIEHLTGALIA